MTMLSDQSKFAGISQIDGIPEATEAIISEALRRNRKIHQPDVPITLHEECKNECRSTIIWQYVEQYPQSLEVKDEYGSLPLHLLLKNRNSIVEDALMMMEKYPLALEDRDGTEELPLHIECYNRCRSIIISKCIELYPQALDRRIKFPGMSIDKSDYITYRSILSTIFTAPTLNWFEREKHPTFAKIRTNPDIRRRILHLLPHNVFDPTRVAYYRDLNWQHRSAMMMFLSQKKIQQQSG
jgi:hypothetical protein